MFQRQNKKKGKYPASDLWVFLRLRIYDTYLSIGCGGDNKAAFPILESYVKEINNIAMKSGALMEPCHLEEDFSSQLHVMNLSGFAEQAGWIMVGMLVMDGWFVQQFQHEMHPRGSQPMIDMLRRSNNA